MNEYQKGLDYLKKDWKCQYYKNIPINEFAKLMNSGNICAISCFKNKLRKKLFTFYCWNNSIKLCQKLI